MLKQCEEPEELEEPEEGDGPLRLPIIHPENSMDELTSEASTIHTSLYRNKGIVPQHLVDKQGKLTITMANITIVDNNEVAPHNS
jgi:hypothetical protein